MGAVLSALERVDPRVPLLVLLIVLSWGAIAALLVVFRVRSDRKAAARAARGPRRLPANLARRTWDFDEGGRPW